MRLVDDWAVMIGDEKTALGTRPRMRDVAALAGVSMQTVSNFVHNRLDMMSVETRDRVARAMDDLRYTPNVAAASLRSQRTRTLAVLVLDEHAAFLADPLTDQLIAGLGDVARDRGYALLIQGARPTNLSEDFLRPLRERRVDGAMLLLSGSRNVRRSQIEAATALGTALVVIDEVDVPDALMSVRAEQERAAKALVSHLIERGHRQIAFIGAKTPWAVIEQRVDGYKAALIDAGIAVRTRSIFLEASYNAKDGERIAARLLGPGRVHTALVCGSDLLAAGALRAARDAGLSVPHDVAIAGFNDFEFAPYLDPPLTTVHIPAYEMGVRAAEMLIQTLNGSELVQRSAVFSADLCVRHST